MRTIVNRWNPALFAKDTAFFAEVLAPNYYMIWGQYHTNTRPLHWGRSAFLEWIAKGYWCGSGVSFESHVLRVTVIGNAAFASTTGTIWVEEGGITAVQNQEDYSHFLLKDSGRWRVVESRLVPYQIPTGWISPPKSAQRPSLEPCR